MNGKRGLRRFAALGLAGAGVWVLLSAANLEGVYTVLHGGARVVPVLLELELGRDAGQQDGLEGWAELVVDQAPVLSAEKEAVRTWQQNNPQQPEPEPEPVAEAAAQESACASESEGEQSCAAVSAPAAVEEDEPVPAPETLDQSREVQNEPQEQKRQKRKIGPGDIVIENHTQAQKAQVKKYWNKTPALKLAPAQEGPQILIVHTHATEAYTMADGDNYQESEPMRTTDENYNVIRVGEEMKQTFEEMGLSVVHDKSTYDYPGYSGSYARSLEGIEKYLKKHPTIQVVLDVHRDAIIDKKGKVYSKTTTIEGEETAQVMLVVGTDDSGLKHPKWRQNYTLALKIQGEMLAHDPTLPRAIDLRSQRFNQHMTPGSLLVEVGTSGNTLRQALAGARRFARCAGKVYQGCVKGG